MKSPEEEDGRKLSEVLLKWGQLIVTAAVIPWGVWVTNTIYLHNMEIRQCEEWRRQRPDFVTKSDQELQLLRKEKELRDVFSARIDASFTELRNNQQAVLERLAAIDKKLAEHMAVK